MTAVKDLDGLDITSESRLDRDRNRYIEQIVRYLPNRRESNPRFSTTTKRQSGHVRGENSGVSSVEGQQDEYNPFLNWKTALAMLKKHYKPQARAVADNAKGIVRQVDHRVSKYGVKQTIRPPEKPTTWTEAALTAYIQDLADFRPPRPILFEVLPTEQKDQKLASIVDVANTMEQTLTDPDLRRYTNIKACNIALQFLYDRSMMTRARRLFSRMEYLCLDTSATTWNIILRACAAQKDLHNFTYLLNEMIVRGFKPDERTWVTFVMVLNSIEAKKAITSIMRRTRIMDSLSIGRDVATQMVRHEFSGHLTQDAKAAPFFTKMGQLYGPDWLSASTGNTLISAVMQTSQGEPIKAVIQALRLLYEMKQHTFKAGGMTMNIFLQKCLHIEEQDLLIEILSIFETHWNLKPDLVAHRTLFELAWRRQRLNMLRVIWISACLNGYVTFRMQDRIMQSLLEKRGSLQISREPTSFDHLVGQFLIGVDHTFKSQLRSDTIHWKPDGEARVADKYVLAVRSNLATAGQGRLKDGIIVQLRLALELDKHWASEGFWTDPKKQAALLKSSVQVHVTRSSQFSRVDDRKV
ncbi:MAG: hypothetical protein Q9217_005282 [Psora testacea]